MDRVADPDLEDPNPDVWELFRHYDGLYFRGALAGAGFAVQWSSPSMIGYFGSCTFGKRGNTITLSEAVLKYRSTADLKNALLHLMIHAIFYVKHDRRDYRSHGPIFRAWMDAINSCSFEDNQRPPGGYNITTSHAFCPEESCSIQGILWKCKSCGDTLVRARKLGTPSDACCIENVDNDATCGNMLCHWHNHKMNCGGTYANAGMVSKPPETPGQKKVPKGTQRLLTDTSDMSKSQRTVPESNSAELQEDATVRKPNAEGKLLSLLGGNNAKPPGSSTSKKVGNELFSLVSCGNAKVLDSCSSKKAGKQHEPEDVQNTIALLAAPQSKLKQSIEISSSNKAGKKHKPEDIQKTVVLPTLKQDLVASEKDELYYTVGCSNAKVLDSSSTKKACKQHEPDDTRKTIALPAAPQSKLKQPNGIFSSIKAGKRHRPEDIQRTIVLPAASRSKLKQSNLLASEKQKRKCKTKKSARGKEFAVISAWLNYYESEGSSGSTKPLVNKRTERRKRARNLTNQITYSRSRKRGTSGSSSIKTQPLEEVSSQQSQPQSPCWDIVVILPADQVVTQAPGDQSQPPAPCLDIVAVDDADQMVPLQSTDPPSLTPSNPSIGPDIIDISDDD